MQSETVFVKTESGVEELENRSHGLGVTTRRLLIQIDGKRSVAQLIHDNARWMDVSAALDELVSHGLIAEPGQTAPSSQDDQPHATGSLREALIAMAVAVLGDKNAQRIKGKLDPIPADDADTLGEVVEDCVRLIRLTIDEDQAEDFRRQAMVILNSPD